MNLYLTNITSYTLIQYSGISSFVIKIGKLNRKQKI